MIDRVLVLCTGNICRSPLAQAELRAQLPDREISSAGIAAMAGYPADPNALAIAEAEGLDLGHHAARQLDDTMVAESDLILVMDQGHADWVIERYPHSKGRVFLLGHWDDEAEVPDPFGHSVERFRRVFELIRSFAHGWVARLSR